MDRKILEKSVQRDCIKWLEGRGGIESKIYAAVMEKKDYTLQHYRRDLFS